MTTSRELQGAFGERVRQLRRLRGWTQEELARRTSRHWTYIGGVERGERNPTLVVIHALADALGTSPGELFGIPHPICSKFNAPARDILDAIERGFRAQIDVKGKLAELYMYRQLEDLRADGAIAEVTWQDADGKPDFLVVYRQTEIVVECKNIRNETYSRPQSYKVELQRTRNSKDGTLTRGYKLGEFGVLGVSLFNQTGRWEYFYIAAKHLDRRSDIPEFLGIMQRVPMEARTPWTPNPLRAFDDVLGMDS